MLAVTNHTFPREAEVTMAEFGHRVLRMPPHPVLPTPVSSHPDMLLFFAPDAIYCTKSYTAIAARELHEISLACGKPIRCIEAEYGSEYPLDVLLNALPMSKYLFCNTKTVAPELTRLGFIPCHVNQGYTKCASLPLGDNALITADASIAVQAKRVGMDVLQITAGHITLHGYNYGFIGGCASFAPYKKTDTVFFCGDLSQHPDAEKIEYFCTSQNVRLVCISKIRLCDIGTIFMI